LGRLLKILENDGLNVEYIYGLTDSAKDSAVLIIRLDDLDKGIQILMDNNITLMDSEQILQA
jgi:hypothetical protein